MENKETEDMIPKALRQNEENKKAKQEDSNKTNKKFIIKFSIFVVVLLLITGGAIYFTIKYLNEPNKENQEEISVSEETKQKAEDSKYAIKSYAETYDTNSLKITKYYDIDGKITTELETGISNASYNTCIEYIQIDGLKDKNIQQSINDRLKQESYNLKDKYVYPQVTANFANVLSVNIYNDKRR